MIDQNVHKYSVELKKLGIEHQVVEHPEFHSVVEVQNYLGLTLADGFSNLLLKVDDKFIAVIRRDDCQLDYEKIKKLVGIKTVRQATEEEFKKVTGLKPGAATAFFSGIKTYLDKKLFEKETLTGGSGSFICSIRYKALDLQKIPGSEVVEVANIKQKIYLANKRILSGITPSGGGSLHIGNYLGAVRQFMELAQSHDCFLFVADLHALTTVQNKEQLQKNVETLILEELSLLTGFLTKEEFENITFFRQSDVPYHTELQTILNNVTPLGLLKRAHAYKDKLQNPSATLRTRDNIEEEINVGLFSYPILMAADILMYKPDLVPVGKDQKQHIEIARDIAERFNKVFIVSRESVLTRKSRPGLVFVLPEAYIPDDVAVVMGTDGKRKMSKSLGNVISIFEPEEVIKKQVMSCYTDPTRKRATDPGHIEGNMVFTYLDFFADKGEVDHLKERYKQGQVADIEVKNYLYETLLKFFAPARAKYKELKNNPDKVKQILTTGAEKARNTAGKTMQEVREAIGITNNYSIGAQEQ
ncbi:tryptophan--tRNA ligase [Patescibacteria group bacterium]|nr:tryptophan--tRNA ligase [Patescibacteria group bacterium]MBU1472878.1 tryptophan--tRNA ligase [Patescibacteria group bacterium]MBU2460060.1 tryptophan--tRNA ligase [Patescibacteria group bacterium]